MAKSFFKRDRRMKPFQGRPDLTPLVDVMFLLLIFFMLSSSYVQVSGIKIDPPQVGTVSTLGIEKFVITVSMESGKPEVFFKDKLVSMEELKRELAKVSTHSKSGTIIIRADKRSPFNDVAELMALAEKAQLSIFLLTVPPKREADTDLRQNE
jgi:biopolymer transport protein ExbD